MKVKDPKGNELVSTLLQVVEKDAQERPTVVRVRYDDETIGLRDTEDPIRRFYIVWAPKGSEILTEGQLRLQQVDLDIARGEVAARDQTIATLRRQIAELEKDNEEKTIELRLLNRERDPTRFTSAVNDEVGKRTNHLEHQLDDRNRAITELESQIRELREAKRRLKEANERLKNGRAP